MSRLFRQQRCTVNATAKKFLPLIGRGPERQREKVRESVCVQIKLAQNQISKAVPRKVPLLSSIGTMNDLFDLKVVTIRVQMDGGSVALSLRGKRLFTVHTCMHPPSLPLCVAVQWQSVCQPE